MAGKATDRKGKGKEVKTNINEHKDALATFTLPDSLPCSEVEFPILIKKTKQANWREILEESDMNMREIQEYVDSKKEILPKSPFLIQRYHLKYEFLDTESAFIQDEVFVNLIPALEETLKNAKLWDALVTQKCFFNGIDHLVQTLWNNNPKHPERKIKNLHLFNMPWVRKHLELNPRPYYPKSWLWPEDYAATLIQKTVRQYFVQREEEVQEMRDFWRKLKLEQERSDMETNPLLAKMFAAAHEFKRN